jgi:adenylate cyclase
MADDVGQAREEMRAPAEQVEPGKRRRLRSGFARYPQLLLPLPGLLATFFLLIAQWVDPPIIHEIGNMTFDTYQRLAPRKYEPAPVRIVDIDDESLRRIGQWPWPRLQLAALNRQLANAGAAAISYDVVFSEPDRTSPARIASILRANPDARGDYAAIAHLADHDTIFAESLAQSPSVVGAFLTRQPNDARPAAHAGTAFVGTPALASIPAYRGAIIPLPAIGDNASGVGSVSLDGDSDGIIRRAPLVARIDDQVIPSLSIEALRVAQGAGAVLIKSSDASGEMGGGAPKVVGLKVGTFEIPTTEAGELWMHYTVPVPERTVPAWKLLQNKLSAAELARLFQGNIVFIGTGAAGLRDLVSTPVSERDLGVDVHAQAVEQIILGKFLSRPDWAIGVERALVLLLGLALSFSLPWVGAKIGGLVGTAALAIVVGSSWMAFRHQGLLLDPTYPALVTILAYVTVTFFAFYREERTRAYIHKAFDRYLSPELVKRIARDPGLLELGGEERDMSVLFCDIRGFSGLSENMSPQRTIGFLIQFLTPMTDILLARHATIDKYIGDAILAFWNAPLADPEHPRNAAISALVMIEALKALNVQHQQDPTWPGDVRIGVGLATGNCCVGNMGSAQRLSYSLIGDTVNLASRLEGLTKQYGVPILMPEAMAARIDDFALIEVDLVCVVGRKHPERLYALFGAPELASDPHFLRLAAQLQALLAAYRSRQWDAAEQLIASMQSDPGLAELHKVADVYGERIAEFRIQSPPDDWDCVHYATQK